MFNFGELNGEMHNEMQINSLHDVYFKRNIIFRNTFNRFFFYNGK